MKLRIRFGALMALLALLVYFAEGVWAATCPPTMSMTGVEEVVERDAAEHSCPMAANHTSSGETESPEQSRSEAPVCPFGPVGAGSSCVAASLPATTVRIAPSFPAGSLLTPSPDAARDLILAAALFHPPKA
jgi:hypothetical protein